MTIVSIDLGTTNTLVGIQTSDSPQPRLLELPDISCPASLNPAVVSPLVVPTRLAYADSETKKFSYWSGRKKPSWFRRGSRPSVSIGALAQPAPAMRLAQDFKHHLDAHSNRLLPGSPLTARQATRAFLHQLDQQVRGAIGTPDRIVLTAPIQYSDHYRRELQVPFKQLGYKDVLLVDEPVAAAVGYGLDITREQIVVLADFGGGTLDVAVVRLLPATSGAAGHACIVPGKAARNIGGRFVDITLANDILEHIGGTQLADFEKPIRDETLLSLRSLKEHLYSFPLQQASIRVPNHNPLLSLTTQTQVTYSREWLTTVLDQADFYREFEACLDEAIVSCRRLAPDLTVRDIETVLMVGGSCLLPQVSEILTARFYSSKVVQHRPFEAVALGAAAIGGGNISVDDAVHHDYAFVTYDRKTHDKKYSPVVEAGARVPTGDAHWVRDLVPTCALGEPESLFKLVICQAIRTSAAEARFQDLANFNLGHTPGDESQTVFYKPLNEAAPTLGHLNPPQEPGDRRPRLRISFRVDANRMLRATVLDLKTRKTLIKDEAVVRLA